MSHYAVAVFSNDGDFDRLLAPYDENNQSQFVFVPVDYQKIVDDFNQFQRENRDWTLDMYIENFGYIHEDYMWGYRHNPHGYWDWYSLDGKDYTVPVSDKDHNAALHGGTRGWDAYVWSAKTFECSKSGVKSQYVNRHSMTASASRNGTAVKSNSPSQRI